MALKKLSEAAQLVYLESASLPLASSGSMVANCLAHLVTERRETLGQCLEHAEHWLTPTTPVQLPVPPLDAEYASACVAARTLMGWLMLAARKEAGLDGWPSDAEQLEQALTTKFNQGIPEWVRLIPSKALMDLAETAKREVQVVIERKESDYRAAALTAAEREKNTRALKDAQDELWAAYSHEYVNQIHADAEAKLPIGFQGLATMEALDTKAKIGEWLRHDLATLLLAGENGREAFWVDRARELYANGHCALDALKIIDCPHERPTNDADELVWQIRELSRWCLSDAQSPPPPKADGCDDDALSKAFSIYTSGATTERLGKVVEVLGSGKTVDEKLRAMDKEMHIPKTTTAQLLANALSVTKTAVINSGWWKKNRFGMAETEAERRREDHKRRAKDFQSDDRAESG